jgi:hypothetical protein
LFQGVELRQGGGDLVALRFKEAGQLQIVAECLHCFIYGKAGIVGRYLEQDAARLTEVHRPEVFPIKLMGYVPVVIGDEPTGHLCLRRIIGGSECDVMY